MGLDLNRFRRKQSQDWLDWLEDEPAPSSVRANMRERAVREASAPVVRRVGEHHAESSVPTKAQPNSPVQSDRQSQVKQISVNIQLPNLRSVTSKAKQLTGKTRSVIQKNQRLAIGLGAAVIIVSSAYGVVQIKKHTADSSSDGKGVLSDQTEKPTFEYSLPKGEESNAEGEVKFDAQKKVVNFRDSIGSTMITVSQQPLPAGFENDTEAKVKKLAEEFSAKDVLVNANPTAYLGTDEKGPQTVIFAKKDLLVFIQSAKQIDKNDWAEYITNLQ